MRLLKAILLLIIISFPVNLYASVKEYRLDNDMKVIIIEDRNSSLATFQIWYRVGARNEPAGKTGISHLLEHMMFKGTKKYGPKQFSNIIQRNGGTDNAFTTKDYTMYFQTLSSDRIGLSIELESDRMKNLLLDPLEVESERNVVMEERRMRYEDDPQNSLYEDLFATAFKIHPYRNPVIGWMSDLASIQRDDLYSYYRKYYTPENAFIVISGDVESEKVIEEIRDKFGIIPSTEGSDIKTIGNKPKAKEPEQMGEKRIFLKRDAELPYIAIAYHVPNFPHEDSFALDVLSTILSDGKSSRLYRNIVHEKKLAINIFSDYNGFNIDPFLFLFGATVAPDRDVMDVEKAIYEEIERLKKEPPTDKEVQKAKNQVEAYFVFSQDSNYSKALYTGIFEMLGDWRLKERYIEGIRKVSPADVQAVARKYFSDENKTVGILVPIKKPE